MRTVQRAQVVGRRVGAGERVGKPLEPGLRLQVRGRGRRRVRDRAAAEQGAEDPVGPGAPARRRGRARWSPRPSRRSPAGCRGPPTDRQAHQRAWWLRFSRNSRKPKSSSRYSGPISFTRRRCPGLTESTGVRCSRARRGTASAVPPAPRAVCRPRPRPAGPLRRSASGSRPGRDCVPRAGFPSVEPGGVLHQRQRVEGGSFRQEREHRMRRAQAHRAPGLHRQHVAPGQRPLAGAPAPRRPAPAPGTPPPGPRRRARVAQVVGAAVAGEGHLDEARRGALGWVAPDRAGGKGLVTA